MFLTEQRVARRYLKVGYGIVLGGSAVAGAVGLILTTAGLDGAAPVWVVVILIVVSVLVGGVLAATGHQMRGGRWGLHVGDEALTVLNGWRRATIPWRDLEHFAIRPWGPARELQVRFRPEVLPPRGFSSGRPSGRGRPATDLTPLFQVSMLGDREAECVTTLAQHLPRRA